MSTPIFAWTPSYDIKTKPEPRIRSVQYGDGYTERAPAGINAIRRTKTLVFDYRADAEATAIIDFLDARGGWQPFYYADPGSDRIDLYTCNAYDRTHSNGDWHTVSATFEQDYSAPNSLQQAVDLYGGMDDWVAWMQALEDAINEEPA